MQDSERLSSMDSNVDLDIKVLYIDDKPDVHISRLLRGRFGEEYTEFAFADNKTVIDLINDSKVVAADLIFVDSRLFEDKSSSEDRFQGEDFRLLLEMQFPLKKCIVVTHINLSDDGEKLKKASGTIEKYEVVEREGKSLEEWETSVNSLIKATIESIQRKKSLLELEIKEGYLNQYMKEQLIGRSQGQLEYSSLKVEQINELVDRFKQVEVDMRELIKDKNE